MEPQPPSAASPQAPLPDAGTPETPALAPDEAIRKGEEAVAREPGNARLWSRLGLLLEQQGRLPEALRAFRRATDADPSYAVGWINLGYGSFLQKNFEGAALAAQKGVDLDPSNAQGWTNLAAIQYAAGHWLKGEEAARRSLALRPDQPTLRGIVGYYEYLVAKWPEAVADLGESVDTWGETRSIFIGAYAEAAARIGHTDDAEKIIQPVLARDPGDAELWCDLGNIRLAEKRTPEASDAFQKALGLAPDNAHALIGAGFVHLLEGKPEEAVASLQKAVEAGPAVQKGWYVLAVAYSALKRPEDAAATYEKMTTLFPLSVTGWAGLAVTSNDPAKARAAALRALEIDPHNRAALENVANGLFREKKWPEAEEATRRELAETPDDAIVWNRLGRILVEEKKYDEGARTLEHAAEIDGKMPAPFQALVLTTLSVAYMNLDAPGQTANVAKADDALRRAVALVPSGAYIWYQIAHCEHLLGREAEEKEALGKINELAQDKTTDLSTLPMPVAEAGADPAQAAATGESLLHQGRSDALAYLWQA
ncbi:MAG TPA: tetratricopeptide repeat protein, partial [Candidatus Methylacidiphilales bacterium]